jgi:hypothetical protein
LWCSFRDQSVVEPEACVGPLSICAAGPPKVLCCSHQHLPLKHWQCTPGGERRKGASVKKYFDTSVGECFLNQCMEGEALPCPEHWVDECQTMDCF